MKEFNDQWTKKNLKRMEKDDITGLLYDLLPEVVSFYIKKGHHKENQEAIKDLFDKMADPKFAKHLKRIVKADDFSPVNPSVATMVADFLANRQEIDAEIQETYRTIINAILKKPVKKLAEKTGLEKEYLSELLVVVPDPEVVGDAKYLGNYVFRVLRKMYALAKEGDNVLTETKAVRKLFKGIFGEDMMNYVAVNVLLERKDNIGRFNAQQVELWNTITNFALEQIEENKKDEVRDLISYYVERREKDEKNSRDFARRCQLAGIADDAYPKIAKAVSKLSEKEKVAKYL